MKPVVPGSDCPATRCFRHPAVAVIRSLPSAQAVAHYIGIEGMTVATGTSAQFHLSIWRDYAPPYRVALRGEQTGFQVVSTEHRLQAEVYSWPLPLDHFSGISKEEIRNRLQERLDELEVSRPPADRSLDVLGDFVAAAEEAIEDGEAVSVPWSSGETTVEINPLLALVLHLKWLIRCLKDRPGISVSVR